jgi:hypothetical protein
VGDLLPDIPEHAPEASLPTLIEARYQKQLDIAQTEYVTRVDAALAVEKARTDTAQKVLDARIDADRAAEIALLKSVHDAYIAVAQGTLDRSVTRAQFLTAAIGAVGTIYTTLLGVNYAVASKQPAPGRALIPVVFLGLAFVLASVYVAYMKPQTAHRRLLPTAVGGTIAEDRLKTFMEWTFAGVLARSWALRSSVVSFGVAIALLPLPFLSIKHGSEQILVLLIAGIPVAVLIINELSLKRRSRAP